MICPMLCQLALVKRVLGNTMTLAVCLSMSVNMAGGFLMVCKNALRGEKPVSETYVGEAQRWAAGLVEREHRGPGDTIDAAMWRAEQKWGIERSTFWSLRYRPPRELFVSVYMRLKHAYETECENQLARLKHELMLTKAAGKNAANSTSVAEAEAFLRKKEARP